MAKRRAPKRQSKKRAPQGRRTTLVTHKVELQQVNGTGTFQLLYLNCLAANINWLESVANSYARYKYLSASVEFVSHMGTQVQGQISMGFSHDELDTPPAGMQQIAQMGGSITKPLSAVQGKIFARANTRRQLPSYPYIDSVKYTTIPVDNRNAYNPFTCWVGIDGNTNGQIIGTLHFAFKVLLLDPIFDEANETQDLSTITPLALSRPNEETDHGSLHWFFCKDRDNCRFHRNGY